MRTKLFPLTLLIILHTTSLISKCSGDEKNDDPRLRYGWIGGDKTYSFSIAAGLPQSEKAVTRGVFKVGTIDLSSSTREAIRLRLVGGGTGTGFIVREDGIVLTCAHVIAGSSDIRIHWKGKRYEGKVVDIDYLNDLAIVKFSEMGLPYLKLSNSKSVDTGQECYQLGYPQSDVLGSDLKINRGIISGKKTLNGTSTLLLDLKVNPGNSGGPLVNYSGQAVGIISALYRMPNPIGIAVPIDAAHKLLKRNNLEIAQFSLGAKLESQDIYKQCAESIVLIKTLDVPASEINVINVGGLFMFERLANKAESSRIKRSIGYLIPLNDTFLLQSKEGVIYRDSLFTNLALSPHSVLKVFLQQLPSKQTVTSLTTIASQPFNDYTCYDSTLHSTEYYGALYPPGSKGADADKLNLIPINMECRTICKIKNISRTKATMDVLIRSKSEVKTENNLPYVSIDLKGEYIFDLSSQSPLSIRLDGELVDNRMETINKHSLQIEVSEVNAKEAISIAYEILPNMKASASNNSFSFRRIEESWQEPDRNPMSGLPQAPALPEVITDQLLNIHVKYLKSDSIENQRDAAKALMTYRPKDKVSEVSSALVDALKNGDQYTAKNVVKALGVWADDKGIRALRDVLKGEVWLRDDAIESLGKLKAIEAADDLIQLWLHKDSSRAHDSLKAMGNGIEERLHKYLSDSDTRIRKSVVKLLEEVGTSKSETELKAALKRETDDTITYAIDQLLYKMRTRKKP